MKLIFVFVSVSLLLPDLISAAGITVKANGTDKSSSASDSVIGISHEFRVESGVLRLLNGTEDLNSTTPTPATPLNRTGDLLSGPTTSIPTLTGATEDLNSITPSAPIATLNRTQDLLNFTASSPTLPITQKADFNSTNSAIVPPLNITGTASGINAPGGDELHHGNQSSIANNSASSTEIPPPETLNDTTVSSSGDDGVISGSTILTTNKTEDVLEPEVEEEEEEVPIIIRPPETTTVEPFLLPITPCPHCGRVEYLDPRKPCVHGKSLLRPLRERIQSLRERSNERRASLVKPPSHPSAKQQEPPQQLPGEVKYIPLSADVNLNRKDLLKRRLNFQRTQEFMRSIQPKISFQGGAYKSAVVVLKPDNPTELRLQDSRAARLSSSTSDSSSQQPSVLTKAFSWMFSFGKKDEDSNNNNNNKPKAQVTRSPEEPPPAPESVIIPPLAASQSLPGNSQSSTAPSADPTTPPSSTETLTPAPGFFNCPLAKLQRLRMQAQALANKAQ